MGKLIKLSDRKKHRVLEVNWNEGTVTEFLPLKDFTEESFSDRMNRINNSLDKINRLMADLKHKAQQKGNDHE